MRPYRCTVLLLYCVALLVACAYVPWKADLRGVQLPLGYAYLWQPPTQQSTGQSMAAFASVDIARLSVTLLAVSAAGGIFLLLGELTPVGLRLVGRLRGLTHKRVLFVASWFVLSLWGCDPCKTAQEEAKRAEEKCVDYCLRYLSPEFAKLKTLEEMAFSQQKMEQWVELQKKVEQFKIDILKEAVRSCTAECYS